MLATSFLNNVHEFANVTGIKGQSCAHGYLVEKVSNWDMDLFGQFKFEIWK